MKILIEQLEGLRKQVFEMKIEDFFGTNKEKNMTLLKLNDNLLELYVKTSEFEKANAIAVNDLLPVYRLILSIYL